MDVSHHVSCWICCAAAPPARAWAHAEVLEQEAARVDGIADAFGRGGEALMSEENPWRAMVDGLDEEAQMAVRQELIRILGDRAEMFVAVAETLREDAALADVVAGLPDLAERVQ